MSCLNKSGDRHKYNRLSLESIEVTRRNTALHSPNYFINGQQRQPTLRLDLTPTPYVPSNRINLGLFLMPATTRRIFPRATIRMRFLLVTDTCDHIEET